MLASLIPGTLITTNVARNEMQICNLRLTKIGDYTFVAESIPL